MSSSRKNPPRKNLHSIRGSRQTVVGGVFGGVLEVPAGPLGPAGPFLQAVEEIKQYMTEKAQMGLVKGFFFRTITGTYITMDFQCPPNMWSGVIRPALERYGVVQVNEVPFEGEWEACQVAVVLEDEYRTEEW